MDLFKEINEMKDKQMRAILFGLLERIKQVENAVLTMAHNQHINTNLIEHKEEG